MPPAIAVIFLIYFAVLSNQNKSTRKKKENAKKKRLKSTIQAHYRKANHACLATKSMLIPDHTSTNMMIKIIKSILCTSKLQTYKMLSQ